MPKKEPTAARVKRLREDRGWSIQALAKKTGFNRTTLYNLESGFVATPRIGTLAELARVFCVSIGQVRGTEALARKGGDS